MALTRRLTRGAALALIGAVLLSSILRPVGVHADPGSTCSSDASAWASAYDGSSSGSASGSVGTSDYSLDSCVGLGQTNAIFQAGRACEDAGIPAGVSYGLGYAVVSWYIVWQDGGQTVVAGPDSPQQYDCADTFS